jgi:hypothetical protein
MPRLLFGPWLPDQPAHLNEGVMQADGAYPIANGYAPIGGFSPAPNGFLPTPSRGAGAYRTGGVIYLFVASDAQIHRYQNSGYTSLVSGLANGLGVKFTPYSTLMIATNGTDPIQKFVPATPTVMTNLGGSPPTARFMGLVRGFLVLGYASDSPLRVAWSDNGNPEEWTAGGGSDAGVFDMAGGGDITGVVGGEYGLIFQENRIVRMSFTGSDTVWQFDEIATDVGCVVPGSIATWGRLTFFLSNRGFMVCDGNTVEAIGNEKIDRTFASLSDRSYIENLTAVVDPRNSLYIVTVPSADPANRIFLYNYALQRWSSAPMSVQRVFSGLAQATSLEELSDMYPDLDAMTVSLDSAAFKGGYPLLLLFDGTNTLGSLSGTPIAATFTDAEREMFQGRQARIKSVRPITDAAAPTVSITGRNSLAETQATQSYGAIRRGGVMPVRESWNLSQVTIAIPPQTWTYAQGVDVDVAQGGRA